MQRTLGEWPGGATESDGAVFAIVIVYEDFETGKNAKRTYDILVEHLGHECHFSSEMWKFDVLSIPKLREMAVRDAAAADIIVVSCHGKENLPAHVSAWLEGGLSTMSNPIALVGLFDDEVTEGPVREYMERLAKRCGIEFFARPELFPWAETQIGLTGVQEGRIPRLEAKTLSTIAGMVRERDPQHWSLDD